jgi:transcriptional regulator with XRE-family HTH domain
MVGAKVPFHVWLKEQRRALDLTQKDLAQRIGCSVVTVKKWESGELRPSKDLAEILAGQFSIPTEQRPAFVRFARSTLAGNQTRSAGVSSHVDRTPWQSLASLHNNLPAPPNAFIGRGLEVAAVRELLHRSGVRLLTLSGPPGIGKTRLSLEVAAEFLADP